MIRPASQDDIDDIARLELELFPNPMSVRMLERELEVGEGLVIGSPVEAYALVRKGLHLLDLTRLGVHPKHQRKGLGSFLLDFILGRGHDVMLTVQKTNAGAMRLYTSKGFVIVGHLQGAGAFVMRRYAT